MAARINSPIQARVLGERLRTARRAREISLKKLGDITGVHHSQISRFENGEAITFSTNLQKICEELGVGLTSTMAGEQAPLGDRVEALLRALPASEGAIDAFVSALERLIADSDVLRALRR